MAEILTFLSSESGKWVVPVSGALACITFFVLDWYFEQKEAKQHLKKEREDSANHSATNP